MVEQFVMKVAKRANDNLKINDCDYIKDGLWYCGKCNTRKQTRVKICGIEIEPMCLCKCKAKERDDRLLREKNISKNAILEERRKECFRNSRSINCNFDIDDENNLKLSKMAKEFVDKFQSFKKEGKGLLLFGNTGTGKSFISACIANALIDRGYTCLFTSFSLLANSFQDNRYNKQDIIDNINSYDLLIIDDMAVERNTEYMNEIVEMIINERYNVGKSLIITTNLTREELLNPATISKQRIFSRLREMCFPYEVKGKDRRDDKLKENYENYKDLLLNNNTSYSIDDIKKKLNNFD